MVPVASKKLPFKLLFHSGFCSYSRDYQVWASLGTSANGPVSLELWIQPLTSLGVILLPSLLWWLSYKNRNFQTQWCLWLSESALCSQRPAHVTSHFYNKTGIKKCKTYLCVFFSCFVFVFFSKSQFLGQFCMIRDNNQRMPWWHFFKAPLGH